MFSPLLYLKRLFTPKQVRFEKLLESIRPTIIVTQDESDAYITITYPIDDEIIQDLEFLLQKGMKVRAEDIASVQEDLEEHIKNHIAETAQDVMHYIHPSGYIISYYNDSHEPPHIDPQNTESHSPTTEQDLDFDYDEWIDEYKEKLQKILSLLQHFHKNPK